MLVALLNTVRRQNRHVAVVALLSDVAQALLNCHVDTDEAGV